MQMIEIFVKVQDDGVTLVEPLCLSHLDVNHRRVQTIVAEIGATQICDGVSIWTTPNAPTVGAVVVRDHDHVFDEHEPGNDPPTVIVGGKKEPFGWILESNANYFRGFEHTLTGGLDYHCGVQETAKVLTVKSEVDSTLAVLNVISKMTWQVLPLYL
jgi:hypothetical protein